MVGDAAYNHALLQRGASLWLRSKSASLLILKYLKNINNYKMEERYLIDLNSEVVYWGIESYNVTSTLFFSFRNANSSLTL